MTMMPITCKEATMRSILRQISVLVSLISLTSQDYGFDYSDDDGNEAGSADVENMYYTAKCGSPIYPFTYCGVG